MQKNADLYNLTQQVQGTMYQAGQKQYLASLSDEERDNQPTRPPLLTIRGGYAESIGWMMVQLREFDPEPLTVEKFRVRAIYSAPRLSQALLELIASEKWANRIGNEYSLTDAGQEVIQNLINQRVAMFANFEPIPADELSKLVDYSHRILQAAIDINDEQATWCLRHSQRRKPNSSTSSINQLIHVCSDYNAWRDDAHMASYRSRGAKGMMWEAFSFVNNGNASTANDLFDQLAYRGWTVAEWQDALSSLVDKGWITGDKAGYQATEDGQTVGMAVEASTNDIFFEAWNKIEYDEQIEYVHLMNKLNDACIAMLSD